MGDGTPLHSGLMVPADGGGGDLRGTNLEQRPVQGPLQSSGQQMTED